MEPDAKNPHPNCSRRSTWSLHLVIWSAWCTEPRLDSAQVSLYIAAFPELDDTNAKEATPSFMERVLAVHSINRATKDMAGTIAESNFDVTGWKRQPLKNSVFKQSTDVRSLIERVLAYFGAVTKSDFRTYFRLNSWDEEETYSWTW